MWLIKGKFQRRDFRLNTLTRSSTFSAQGSLFAHLGKHEIFTPAKSYPPMTVSELAAALGDAPTETTPGPMHQVGEDEGLKATMKRLPPTRTGATD